MFSFIMQAYYQFHKYSFNQYFKFKWKCGYKSSWKKNIIEAIKIQGDSNEVNQNKIYNAKYVNKLYFKFGNSSKYSEKSKSLKKTKNQKTTIKI